MRSLVLLIFVVLLISCEKKEGIGPHQLFDNDKNETDNPITSEEPNEERKGVFIANEGNFTWGNATLSYYDKAENVVENGIYKTKTGNDLGDVFQSSYIIGDYIFLLINNSNKIEVLHKGDFTHIKTISNVHSPRQMLKVSDTKAYITSIYGSKIHVLDIDALEITSTISLSEWSENMVLVDNKVYLANTGNNKIKVLDINTNSFIDSVSVGEKPTGLVVDKNDKIWVLCIGKYGEITPSLHKIDRATLQEDQEFVFIGNTVQPSKLTITNSKDELLFLYNGLQKMNISDANLPAIAQIPSNGENYYGLGLDKETGDIYISNAKDFVQSGEVYRYANNFTPIDTFSVGIIPGNFTFD